MVIILINTIKYCGYLKKKMFEIFQGNLKIKEFYDYERILMLTNKIQNKKTNYF